MSRIGLRPISVPSGVDINIDRENRVIIKGPKGQLESQFDRDMRLERSDNTVTVARPDNNRKHRSLHGLTRTLVNNMVLGVTEGFKRELEIQGVGYRAAMDGKTLVLSVGYSHPVRMEPPEGVSFSLEGPTRITVNGIDKQAVGEEAARIRRVRPPEPYKGKGIRYVGEHVQRKAGKAGKAR